jgi:phage protein U
MLMVLGPVVFEIAPVNIQKWERDGQTKFVEHKVVGAEPIYEFTGAGERNIELKGKLFPEHFGGLSAMDVLEGMRRSGQPQHLMRGDGYPVGWVLVEKFKEDHGTLNGVGVGREVEFTIQCIICNPPSPSSYIDFTSGGEGIMERGVGTTAAGTTTSGAASGPWSGDAQATYPPGGI